MGATSDVSETSVDLTDVPPDSFKKPGLPQDKELPQGMAPMIRNAWYVIAEREQIKRELGSIRVLGQPLVYYRTEEGVPVVLDDRCAHRRYPLSKGVLNGDDVRCGYHGFTYSKSGHCVLAPAQKEKKMGFGVRSYPVHEYGPWVWVWMGDPERADPRDIPLEDGSWDPTYNFCLYTHNPGNYLLLIENLLDLTHIHFLHGEAAASIEQVEEPVTPLDIPNGAGWKKEIDREYMGLIAHWTGGDPEQWIKSYSDDKQIGPSFNHSLSIREALPGEEDKFASPREFYVAHAITPEDETNTHQFTFFRVSEPLVMPHEALIKMTSEMVFADDVEAIRCMQENILLETRTGTIEFGIVNDRFGMKMRRLLADLKEQEMEVG
jgi:vanillate O-demethylase monooxygenase subunit